MSQAEELKRQRIKSIVEQTFPEGERSSLSFITLLALIAVGAVLVALGMGLEVLLRH